VNKTYETIRAELKEVESAAASYGRIYDYAIAEGFYEIAKQALAAESAANNLYHSLYSQATEMLVN
tara:strand:- start:732 stop:929 length:198 start_codon:yes stop_codon:yes gene_type:complete